MSVKYFMKQKMIAIGDDFSIKDENGREAFYVDGRGLLLEISFLSGTPINASWPLSIKNS